MRSVEGGLEVSLFGLLLKSLEDLLTPCEDLLDAVAEVDFDDDLLEDAAELEEDDAGELSEPELLSACEDFLDAVAEVDVDLLEDTDVAGEPSGGVETESTTFSDCASEDSFVEDFFRDLVDSATELNIYKKNLKKI